jgi:hypothetical protein
MCPRSLVELGALGAGQLPRTVAVEAGVLGVSQVPPRSRQKPGVLGAASCPRDRGRAGPGRRPPAARDHLVELGVLGDRQLPALAVEPGLLGVGQVSAVAVEAGVLGVGQLADAPREHRTVSGRQRRHTGH